MRTLTALALSALLLLSSVTVGRRADEGVVWVGAVPDRVASVGGQDRLAERDRPARRPVVRPLPVSAVRSTPRLPANPPRAVAKDAGSRQGRIRGQASFYCSPAHPICHYRYPVGSMVAAACGRLRDAIGPKWRGRVVTVRAGSRSVLVQLVDWCGSSSKTIDLYAAPFQRLAPLSRGVVEVSVSW